MTNNDYRSYPLVDTAVGTRLLLGFIVSPTALQARLPPRWQIAPLSAFEAVGLPEERQPNLLLAFHHLLLDQDAHGQVLTDSGSRFLVFDILARNPDTSEHGLVQSGFPVANPFAQLVGAPPQAARSLFSAGW